MKSPKVNFGLGRMSSTKTTVGKAGVPADKVVRKSKNVSTSKINNIKSTHVPQTVNVVSKGRKVEEAAKRVTNRLNKR